MPGGRTFLPTSVAGFMHACKDVDIFVPHNRFQIPTKEKVTAFKPLVWQQMMLGRAKHQPSVQENHRASAAFQDATQALQSFRQRQVDLIQEHPITISNCFHQCPFHKVESQGTPGMFQLPSCLLQPLYECLGKQSLHSR